MLPIEEKIPEKLSRLPELANNLWWSWTLEARNLFKRLDYPLWRKTHHNPVEMLNEMSVEDALVKWQAEVEEIYGEPCSPLVEGCE